MAFEGDLSNLSLGDVLQTIAATRQVGTFVIKGEEERRLACGPQGVALLSSRTSLGLRIGTVLLGSGKVTQEQIDQALKVQRRRRDTLVGQILVEQQSCTSDDVRTARRYLAAEEIFDLFMWKHGKFEFLPEEADNVGPFADLWFDVGSLAMEAARRLDELPRAVQTAPEGEVFVVVDGPNDHRAQADANRDLSAVLGHCNGAHTVADVLEAHYRGRFDTWKALESLIDWKLLRPATKDEIVVKAEDAAHQRDFVRAARLFKRASDHDPADDAVRQCVAEALRDSGDKRQAAEQLVLVGKSRLAAEKLLPAIDAFRQAISLDANNPAAHEGLLETFAGAGQVDDAVVAARAAAALRIQLGDFAGACRVAELGLAQDPGDTQLHVHLANANHGLGRSADAVRLLDDVATMLEAGEQAEGDRRLLDVYRRIVQIAPERKDAARRVEEIQAYELTRRRRIMQRIAMAAGLVVLAMVGVVVFRKPPVGKLLDELRAYVDAKNLAEAQTALVAIESRSMSPDEEIELTGLKARIETLAHPPESAEIRKRLDAAVDDAARTAMNAIQDEKVAEGLGALLALLDVLDRNDTRKLKALDQSSYEKLRSEAFHEVQNALGVASTISQKVAARVTGMRDRFDENVWKREDLDTLHDLITQSGIVLEGAHEETWAQVPTAMQSLEKRGRVAPDSPDRKKVLDASSTVVEACKELRDFHDRALSRARRKELRDAYKAAYASGKQAERDGRISEALEAYEAFLAQCETLRAAQPDKLYAPIRNELFGNELHLDANVQGWRDSLAGIVKEEDEALKAESGGDCETAFRVRKRLVVDHRDIDFSRRFRMPLRIETAPAGAEVFLADGSPTGQDLGATPNITNYPIEGGVKFEVRLAGYKTHVVFRKGAIEDATGVERIELAKLATWKTDQPAGVTVAAPTPVPGAVLVVGRSGLVRRVELATGEETRFETKLMDGFACTSAVRGDHVFAVSLDGRCYVVSSKDLSQIATFDTGRVSAAPLATKRGVIVADEAGFVRLVDDAGVVLWTKRIGRVRAAPAAAGDKALLVTVDGEAVLIDGNSGETLRRRQLQGDAVWGAPTVRGSRAFLANEVGEIVCLDVHSLSEVWSQKLEGRSSGRICAGELRLLVCTVAGAVLALDAENGATISRTLVGGKLDDNQNACELPDGGFVVVTKKGQATRFDAKGDVIWRFNAGEDVSAAPTLVEGSIIVVTLKGVVISLKP